MLRGDVLLKRPVRKRSSLAPEPALDSYRFPRSPVPAAAAHRVPIAKPTNAATSFPDAPPRERANRRRRR